MLKSTGNPSDAVAIPYSNGPVFYRNSFEKRITQWQEQTNGPVYSGVFNLDPCFYKNENLNNFMVNLPGCEITDDAMNAHSGNYSVKVSGNPASTLNALYDYKIADVNIPVVEKLKISFWKNTVNELGRYVSIDLKFESGKRLGLLTGYTDQSGNRINPSAGIGKTGAGYEQFVCEIGKGELTGDKIVAIIVSYNKGADAGSYLAYFDDILLTTGNFSIPAGIATLRKKVNRITVANQILNFGDIPLHSEVTIYTVTGAAIKSFHLKNPHVPVHLKTGIYLITVSTGSEFLSQKVVMGN